MGQLGGFLDRLLGPLLKTRLPLLKRLTKNVLIPLGSTATASATDSAIHKKIFESGLITLITSNEEMNIMKIVKSLHLLMQGISEKIKNEAKEQKRGFSVWY